MAIFGKGVAEQILEPLAVLFFLDSLMAVAPTAAHRKLEQEQLPNHGRAQPRRMLHHKLVRS